MLVENPKPFMQLNKTNFSSTALQAPEVLLGNRFGWGLSNQGTPVFPT
jgi:hypothetical protein